MLAMSVLLLLAAPVEGRQVQVSFKNRDIAEIFEFVSAFTGEPSALDECLKGRRVTFRLPPATAAEVLDALGRQEKLVYERRAGKLFVGCQPVPPKGT